MSKPFLPLKEFIESVSREWKADTRLRKESAPMETGLEWSTATRPRGPSKRSSCGLYHLQLVSQASLRVPVLKSSSHLCVKRWDCRCTPLHPSLANNFKLVDCHGQIRILERLDFVLLRCKEKAGTLETSQESISVTPAAVCCDLNCRTVRVKIETE